MKVSRKAEYACIAMVELAASYAERQPIHVRRIAEAHHIPQRFLVQILLQLKVNGLVESIRGAAGGYQLARRPDTISLANIIGAIDHSATEHSPARSAPVSPAAQAVRTVWQEIQAEEQRMLEEITLVELVRRSQPSSALSYQI
jgi:Rrf2 family cysteine metabolism transcriptional repressor